MLSGGFADRKHSYHLASVEFLLLSQIGTSGSDLERRSNGMYELCRLRRSEGYEVCFDERAVEVRSHCKKRKLFTGSNKGLTFLRKIGKIITHEGSA